MTMKVSAARQPRPKPKAEVIALDSDAMDSDDDNRVHSVTKKTRPKSAQIVESPSSPSSPQAANSQVPESPIVVSSDDDDRVYRGEPGSAEEIGE